MGVEVGHLQSVLENETKGAVNVASLPWKKLQPSQQAEAVMKGAALKAYDALPRYWFDRILPMDFCLGYYFGRRAARKRK